MKPIRHSSTTITALIAAAGLSCLSSASLGGGGVPGDESLAAFNTHCARCHEAQCSGRLSFEDSFERSRGHMVRHYPPAERSDTLRRELFALLEYMKGRCGFHPMPASLPSDGRWDADRLERYSTPTERNYFIPLGEMKAGEKRLTLTLEGEARITVHLLSSQFEMVVDDCFQSAGGRIEIPFLIEEEEVYFLRLYPREPVRLIGLRFSPAGD